MMNNEISNRDLELLSAYLDQELSPKDQARIETRLQSSPELRSILGELHQNRAALRSLPHLRAPRNFTLSPEFFGIKPKKRTYPIFGLASAISSLVLILVLVGDFLINPATTSIQTLVEQPASLTQAGESVEAMDELVEKAVEEIPPTQVVEAPMLEAQEMPATSTDEMEELVENAPEEPSEEEGTTLGIEIFSSKLPEGALTPSPEGLSSTTTPTSTIVYPTDTPSLASPSATAESEMEERIESITLPTPTSIESQPQITAIPLIRILEFSLAAITLITGLIAIILHRKYR